MLNQLSLYSCAGASPQTPERRRLRAGVSRVIILIWDLYVRPNNGISIVKDVIFKFFN